MKVPYNWLKEYIDFELSPAELADKLTMSGLEVEFIEQVKPQFESIKVGKIISVTKHPNAEKLSLCEVVVKDGAESLAIVCGAKNMKTGDKVAVALDGSKIKDDIKINKTKIRGVDSQGMICSEVELGLSEESSGVIILPSSVQLGIDLDDFLQIKDSVLEVNVTPNRPDCLSILGIAKEVSVFTSKPVTFPVYSLREELEKTTDCVDIAIADFAGCPRYTGRIIKDVKIGPSDLALQVKLKKVGLRPVNNVVDITNYVLMEYGHPLHAFDYDLLAGKKIIVRRAKKQEKLVAIDGREYGLDKEVLCIADANTPLAVAGIMGGKSSEVSENSHNILLESAYFHPPLVRRASKKLGLSSDSSYRFERGTDYDILAKASDRAACLIGEMAEGKILKGIIDLKKGEKKPAAIIFRIPQCNKILGTEVEAGHTADILSKLNCEVDRITGDTLKVVPPSYRTDLEREIDLIEEVARIYGYDNLNMRVNSGRPSLQKGSSIEEGLKKVRNILVGLGLKEVINYSFINKNFKKKLLLEENNPLLDVIEIANPLNEDYSVMRTALVHGLLMNVSLNQAKGNLDLSYYETGKVYTRLKGSVKEEEKLGIVLSGNRFKQKWYTKGESSDFFTLKGIIEVLFKNLGISNFEMILSKKSFFHPKKGIQIRIGGETVGFFGEIIFDVLEQYDIENIVLIAELSIFKLVCYINETIKYQELPKYPATIRDLAFISDKKVSHIEIVKAVNKLKIPILESFYLFDVYCGQQVPADKKSLAYSFKYRDKHRTLKDGEVNKFHDKIINILKKEFGCIIR